MACELTPWRYFCQANIPLLLAGLVVITFFVLFVVH